MAHGNSAIIAPSKGRAPHTKQKAMTKKLVPFIVAASLFVSAALPLLAQSPSPIASPTPAVSPRPIPKTVDFACLQNAAERRDNSIIAAFDAYHAGVKTALEARRDGLKAALAITDKAQRQGAVRNAWNTYKSIQKKTKDTLKNARNAAWQKFNTDRKACGPGAASEDKTPSGVDAQL